MGVGLMASKQCDSCKSSPATLFCRPDSAFLCSSCDSLIHSANKLASRHPRFFLCDVCEQSAATVSCKADAAHLCSSCDLDIHSANPLSRRHDRIPLSPFFNDHLPDDNNDADDAPPPPPPPPTGATAAALSKLFGDDYYSDSDDAEAASWLLSNTKTSEDEPKSIDYLFGDTHSHVASFLDLVDPPKPDPAVDCLVPDPDPHPHPNNASSHPHSMYSLSSYNHNFNNNNNNNNNNHNNTSFETHPQLKQNHYHFPPSANQPSLTHSVSSSSLEFGVVPDANAMADVGSKHQIKMMGLDREARVLRYREKRKNRKFEKTIRYASRKAYAETRPRIKGRFAKRTDVDPAASVDTLFASDPDYGVVPSF